MEKIVIKSPFVGGRKCFAEENGLIGLGSKVLASEIV